MYDDCVLKTNKGYLTYSYLGSSNKEAWFTNDKNDENVYPFDSELSYNFSLLEEIADCEVIDFEMKSK